MEKMLEVLKSNGWEYSLTYSENQYSLIVWRPEWVTDNLYQARTCPQTKGDDPQKIISAMLEQINLNG